MQRIKDAYNDMMSEVSDDSDEDDFDRALGESGKKLLAEETPLSSSLKKVQFDEKNIQETKKKEEQTSHLL
jgi:hypothetical protein